MFTFNRFKTIRNSLLLCCCAILLTRVEAQQFQIYAAPAAANTLQHVTDLQVVSQKMPVSLMRTAPRVAGQPFGVSLQHYKTTTGEVLNNVFNYITPVGAPAQQLMPGKFAEGFGAYYVAGTTRVVSAAGTLQTQLFLLQVRIGNGAIIAARRIELPAGFTLSGATNILMDFDAIYVSGVVVSGGTSRIFCCSLKPDLNSLNWFQVYDIAARQLTTFAQCLAHEGSALALAGVDRTRGTGLVFTVQKLNGLVVNSRNLNLCTALACHPIQKISLGFSENYRNVVVESSLLSTGRRLFHVAQMNPGWVNVVNGTTYETSNWGIYSVRFERPGVLIGHYNGKRYITSRYKGDNGALVGGSLTEYDPAGLSLVGVKPQLESIGLSYADYALFSVGRYASGGATTFGLLQKSKCQFGGELVVAPERLTARAEPLHSIRLSLTPVPMEVRQIDLPMIPKFVCNEAVADPAADREAPVSALKANFSVAPNPFFTDLTVRSATGIADIQVFDLTGRVVTQRTFATPAYTETIDLTQLQPGIYMVQARDAAGRLNSRKVVKQ